MLEPQGTEMSNHTEGLQVSVCIPGPLPSFSLGMALPLQPQQMGWLQFPPLEQYKPTHEG